MALTDVEANYTVVKAYQFTTLTSIQVDYIIQLKKKDPHINTITANINNLCAVAAGLLCDPGSDGALMDLLENSL